MGTAAACFGFIATGIYIVMGYRSWQRWQGQGVGPDMGDTGMGEPPTLYHAGVSYQNMEPLTSAGFRPGTDHTLPPPHMVAPEQMLPMKTPGRGGRLEFVD